MKNDKRYEILEGLPIYGDEYITVSDNGIGMTGKETQKAFQLFRQLNKREKYKGLGLGLTICKRVVDLHDGKIWVDSEPDQGSTFYFTLPV